MESHGERKKIHQLPECFTDTVQLNCVKELTENGWTTVQVFTLAEAESLESRLKESLDDDDPILCDDGLLLSLDHYCSDLLAKMINTLCCRIYKIIEMTKKHYYWADSEKCVKLDKVSMFQSKGTRKTKFRQSVRSAYPFQFANAFGSDERRFAQVVIPLWGKVTKYIINRSDNIGDAGAKNITPALFLELGGPDAVKRVDLSCGTAMIFFPMLVSRWSDRTKDDPESAHLTISFNGIQASQIRKGPNNQVPLIDHRTMADSDGAVGGQPGWVQAEKAAIVVQKRIVKKRQAGKKVDAELACFQYLRGTLVEVIPEGPTVFLCFDELDKDVKECAEKDARSF